MAIDRPTAILRHIRRLAAGPMEAALTDRELLHRFGTQRDEAAFATLVRRHGRLVLGVCRRVLGQEQDAEDVFQATFLILARKAAAQGWRESVGNWLYRVAYRLAVRARRQAGRRQTRERQSADRRTEDPLAEVTLREARQVFDDELNRLPDKFRAPLVLCYLEGQTRDEAAQHMGWSVATLKRRLERGRELLAARLRRRGLTLTALFAGLAFSESAASPAVPGALFTSTVAAALLADPTAVVSAQTAWLVRDALPTLLTGKVKAALGVVLGAVLTAGLSATLLRPAPPAETPVASPSKEASSPGTEHSKDSLPAGAAFRLGSLRLRHKMPIHSLAFASAGNSLIAGSNDSVIHFWDPTTGEKTRSLDGEGALAVSPDGKTLAAWQGETVALWDVATGKQLRKLAHPSGKASGRHPLPLRFAPDGKTIAGMVGDRSASIWDTATGRELAHLPPQEKPIVCLSFAPDGKDILTATGSRQEEIVLRRWDVATGKERHTIRIPAPDRQAWLRPLAFSADGKTIALEEAAQVRRKQGAGVLVFTEYRLVLMDVATGREQRRLDGTDSVVWSAAFSRDGRRVACQRMDGSVSVWDAASGAMRFTHRGYPGGSRPDSVFTLDFTPDGKRLATAGDSGVIDLWDVETGRELSANAQTHHGTIACLAFAPDGKIVATGGHDQTIRLWDTATSQQRHCLAGHTAVIRQLIFSPDGRTLVSAGMDDSIRLWDTATGKERCHFIQQRPASSSFISWGAYALAFSPDGQALASWGEDQMLRTWNLTTRKESLVRQIALPELPPMPQSEPGGPLHIPKDHVQWAAFTPDVRTVLLASNKAIHLVDVASGRRVFTFASPARLTGLDLSPDGQTLLAGCNDKTVRLFEVATGQEALRVPWPERPGRIAFASDGRSAAVAADFLGIIRILDATTGRERAKFADVRASIYGLAFRPDGRILAAGLSNSTALLWNVPTPSRPDKKELPTAKLDQFWDDLAGSDVTKAYAALGTLTAHPEQAVALLSARLRPAVSVDPKRIAALIAQLDHIEYAKREEASRELKKLGTAAEGPLRSILERSPSEEVRRRVRDILATPAPWTPPDAEALRRRRAIQLLERIASPAAGRILDKLAQGAATSPETRCAEEARKRLSLRGELR